MARDVVAVITDSACGIAPQAAASFGVLVVPVSIEGGGESHRDGPVRSHAAATMLGTAGALRTAAPTVAEMANLYRAAADSGADRIVAVMGGVTMSDAVTSAREAAPGSPIPVTVVDTGTVAVGQALAALAAGAVGIGGASADTIAGIAQEVGHRTQMYATVETLEHFRRSGHARLLEDSLGGVEPMRPILRVNRNEAAVVAQGRGEDGARLAVRELVNREARSLRRPVGAVGLSGDSLDPEQISLDVEGPVLVMPSPMSILANAGPGLFMAAATEMPEAFHRLFDRMTARGDATDESLAWTRLERI
ncbi:DegV family protein [Demequina salsinemoris]|uniref:DegV family protein n=1 Tax=Demequina salsinemoris TaxID=577470 RepID=UPI000782AE5D|nr:DegV family protein [Demequina salsinemoris]